MDHDELRDLIAAARTESRRVAAQIMRASWQAGADDTTRPAALAWVRRWRPDKLGVTPVACSCATGRCAVCN